MVFILFLGDELWKAVVAQRKKPKSLIKDIDELDMRPMSSTSVPTNDTSLEDFENMLISDQAIHSFPDDKPKPLVAPTEEVELCTSKYKNQIGLPHVIGDNTVEESEPLFRPRERIVVKTKKKDSSINGEINAGSANGLLTSTPTKHGSMALMDHSLDLFSDNSTLIEEEPPLCEDFGRHVVLDCSVG